LAHSCILTHANGETSPEANSSDALAHAAERLDKELQTKNMTMTQFLEAWNEENMAKRKQKGMALRRKSQR